MVEQNARRALALSHRGYVLDLGKNRYEGTERELLNDQRVAELYLGGRPQRRPGHDRELFVPRRCRAPYRALVMGSLQPGYYTASTDARRDSISRR